MILRKSIIPHIVVMVQIIAMSVAFVVLYNVTNISNMSISIFQDGGYRSILCMNPILDTQSLDHNFKFDIIQKAAQSPWYIGSSSIGWCFCMDSYEAFGHEEGGGENAEIITINDFALNGFNIPVSSGRQLTDSEILVNGEIPCVIGGKNANNFNIGSTFTGYVLIGEGVFTSTEEFIAAPKDKVTFRVEGKLSKPEQILNVKSNMSWSGEIPASRLLDNYYDTPLFAIIPERLFPYIRIDSQMVYLFFSKNTPENEMQILDNMLGGSFAKTDTELIKEEEIELKNNEEILRPFTGLLLLTSVASVFSLGLLTTVRNANVLSIYYLVGCPRRRVFVVVTVSALTHVLFSLIIFLFAMTLLSNSNGTDIVGYYFILTPQSYIIVGILSISIVITAFLSGIIAIQKRTVSFMITERK